MAPKAAPARQRLEVSARRAQLVALGMEVFSRRAYDEVSIDDLARAAGISKGLLYHYFPTKRDFYVATVREGARQLLAAANPDPRADPMTRLHLGLDAYLDYVSRHGRAYASLLRSGVGADPAVARIVDRTRNRFMERVAAGLPLPSPSPLMRVALRGWVGFVEATSLAWVEAGADAGPVPRAVLRDLIVRVAVNTVAAVVPA